ncbi:6-pyruvoyl tetrahydropterin synthase family protein [Streptomyces lavendulae]|uniref:6-pyruvoyl trahydropterin synthase family protein n=1 Tax=Streptomyces lavendulae TaxID=1914 RepID=UPI0036BD19BE
MSSTQPLFRIGKGFRFEATRRLADGRYDGHSFTAEAALSSLVLSPEGFVADFDDLAPLKRYIDGALDHQILNDCVKDVYNEGSAEHLLGWARDHLPSDAASVLERIRVRIGRPSRCRRPRSPPSRLRTSCAGCTTVIRAGVCTATRMFAACPFPLSRGSGTSPCCCATICAAPFTAGS